MSPGPILGTEHGVQGMWEILGEEGVWPSGSQSNALLPSPRFLCCLHAFSVCNCAS